MYEYTKIEIFNNLFPSSFDRLHIGHSDDSLHRSDKLRHISGKVWGGYKYNYYFSVYRNNYRYKHRLTNSDDIELYFGRRRHYNFKITKRYSRCLPNRKIWYVKNNLPHHMPPQWLLLKPLKRG